MEWSKRWNKFDALFMKSLEEWEEGGSKKRSDADEEVGS